MVPYPTLMTRLPPTPVQDGPGPTGETHSFLYQKLPATLVSAPESRRAVKVLSKLRLLLVGPAATDARPC